MRTPPVSLFTVCPCVWGAACVIAFLAWYADPDARYNPQHDNQLRSLSGIMTFNKPLFSFLMSGFGIASLAGLVVRFQQHPAAVMLSLGLCWALVGLLCFDIRDFRVLHFLSLLVFMASGLTLTHIVDARDVPVPLCDGLFALFAGVLLVNVACAEGVYPLMTIQAVCEIMWVLVFSVWVANQAALE